jgi:MFS family permease
MCLALMMVVGAVASLNVALPEIARAPGASQTQLQWIVAAYALAFAGPAAAPPGRSATGSAASPSGRRPRHLRPLLAGCRLPNSPGELIALRGAMASARR